MSKINVMNETPEQASAWDAAMAQPSDGLEALAKAAAADLKAGQVKGDEDQWS